MGTITFLLYLGVLVIWALWLLRMVKGPKPVPRSTKTNVMFLTVIVVILTVLQVTGMGG